MNPGARDNKPAQFPTLPMGVTATLGAEIAIRFGWPEVQTRTGLWREFQTPMGKLTDMAITNHFIKLAHAFNTEDVEQIRIVLHGDYGSMAAPSPVDKGSSYGT